jgi:hypothetical protein
MKRLALYPYLFILYAILTPLAHNLDRLDPSLALRPLIVLCLAAVSGLLLFYFLFRDWCYAGYLVFLVTLFFCATGHINRFVQDWLSIFGLVLDKRIFLAICAVLLGILAIKGVWARLGGRTWLTPYLNLVIAIGLLFPVYGLFSELFPDPLRARKGSEKTQASFGEVIVDCSITPDIYYIILDGYGRADVLADLYKLDNQPFLEYLRGKGFYVATESHTNYIQTIFSIPSSLNFNFIDPPGEGINSQLYFSGLMKYNDIMTTLKRCGYRTVAIESGFYFTNHPKVDDYLERGIGPNEFESLLLADSPVEVLADELHLVPSEYSYEAHRQRVLYSFEKLSTLYSMNGPKFIFAHIIAPHPPFVFDRYGHPVTPEYSYYIGDGDDYQGNLEDYLSGYPEQVLFVNHKMEQVIDAILANSLTPPVIIIQGDHGPGSRLVWDMPAQTCLWERTSILNAYYLPGEGERLLYASISPVNSFRVVLNAYFNANLPLLPDDTYFTSHRLERQAIDISVQRSSRANCYPP